VRQAAHPHADLHTKLLANCLAQSQALMLGKTADVAATESAPTAAPGLDRAVLARHRSFPGNRPSTTFVLDALTPRSLGALIALYEHRVFTSGALWGINSFDQWGVELGKALCNELLPRWPAATPTGLDASTAGLLKRTAAADFAPFVSSYATLLPRHFSVPTDLDRVQYPQSYQSPTRSRLDVSFDPCRLDLDVVSYPQDWMGSLPLPPVRGAPLPASFGRGMKIKDIMLADNPAFVLPGAPGAPAQGCKGSLRAEFDRTIARLKKLGVEHVEIPQWHWTSKRPDGSWYWVRAEDSFGPLPDADLVYFVDRAHRAGLKVIMRNSSLGMVDNPVGDGAAYVPPPTLENLTKWFAAYQAFIAERAGFFQSIGIDAWELTCGTCMYHDDGDGTAAARALTAAEYGKALTTIRANFKGQVFASTAPWLLDRPDVMRQVDFMMTSLWIDRFAETDDQALTVDSFKAALALSGAASSLRYLSGLGRPLIVQLDWVQSRRNLLTLPGYMEETSCTSSIGNLNPSESTCIQQQTSPDFSRQAVVFEALLETVAANLTVPGSIVLAGEYWVTDPLLPATAYPNLAASPRNKPAEGLLKAWFRR
jgi:hypothetical protein